MPTTGRLLRQKRSGHTGVIRAAGRRALTIGIGVTFAAGLGGAAVVIGAGPALAAGPDPAGTVYVSDESTHSIDVFAPGTNGNVAPLRTISGSNTGLGPSFGPDDVKVDPSGDVWAATFDSNSIVEFAPGASGNATPICTISGSNTGLSTPDDFSIGSDGTVYVANFGTSSVVVFAPGACGNVTPEITLSGSNTGLSGVLDGIGVDATGTIYVADTGTNTIDVFAPGANGNVAPERTISGAATGLGGPDDVVVGFDGKLYVSNGFGSGTNSVTVYAPGASGNVAPIQQVQGSNTGFGNPDDLAVDTSGDFFVSDESSSFGPAVLEWAAGSNGNVAPTKVISGSATTLSGPEGVAVSGPPKTVSATLSSQDSASSIALGSPTSDTATLAGGTIAPTGSLEFKLFGPGDTTCSGAPVYTSPFVTVSGDGSYPSPTTKPAAVGTYRWVALYSGDANNAPASTVCGDPNETVTVAASGVAPVVDDSSDGLGSTSITNTNLITSVPNELVVAYVSADGPASGGQTVTVSGSSLTWTRVAQENGALGDTEVWVANAGTHKSVNVTAKVNKKGYQIDLVDVSYKNASGIGASGTFESASGAPTGAVTTTQGNSWVWAVGFDWATGTGRTVGSGQTLFSQNVETGPGNTFWVQSTTSPTPAAGTSVTINDTAPKTDPYDLVLVEIL
jgi:sugar lactone lactonase YvrE